MTRGTLLVAVGVTAWALGTAPAWAQRDRGGAATTGSSVDRGSGGSSSSGSGGGGDTSSGGSSSGGSSSSPGSYSAPSTSSPSGSREYATPPVHPNREAGQGRVPSAGRRPSSDDDGDRTGSRAMPRGMDAAGSPSSGGRTANAVSGDGGPSRRAVPTYSRPRDGNPVTGTAVDRRYPYYGGGSNSIVYYPYYPYYAGYGGYYSRYYYPGYAFGLGFYDFGWYDPYAYGGGFLSPSFYGGYGGGGYQSGASGVSSYGQAPTGSLRLKIKPREAQVYVDGYFVGEIDSFDGAFQKLGIDAGSHKIEVKAPGFEAVTFDVVITPNETVTYKGELRRIQ